MNSLPMDAPNPPANHIFGKSEQRLSTNATIPTLLVI